MAPDLKKELAIRFNYCLYAFKCHVGKGPSNFFQKMGQRSYKYDYALPSCIRGISY